MLTFQCLINARCYLSTGLCVFTTATDARAAAASRRARTTTAHDASPRPARSSRVRGLTPRPQWSPGRPLRTPPLHAGQARPAHQGGGQVQQW